MINALTGVDAICAVGGIDSIKADRVFDGYWGRQNQGCTGSDTLNGGPIDDEISGEDTIFWLTGVDTLRSGTGDDSIVGQMGDDIVFGLISDDLFFENEGRTQKLSVAEITISIVVQTALI